MIITAVERKRKRVSVYVDGELALEMGAKLASERDVRPGRSVTSQELEELAVADAGRIALETAVRLLAYRPRSVHELRERLARKGTERPIIEVTIGRLKDLGYLDDAEVARSWTETRQEASPRSGRLLASELRLRGIDPTTATQATAEISDDDAAYEAASRRLQALRGLEYHAFRERLGRFLTSRGFGYDVARGTIERCWGELGGESDGESGG